MEYLHFKLRFSAIFMRFLCLNYNLKRKLVLSVSFISDSEFSLVGRKHVEGSEDIRNLFSFERIIPL